jgi:hypothetical protein
MRNGGCDAHLHDGVGCAVGFRFEWIIGRADGELTLQTKAVMPEPRGMRLASARYIDGDGGWVLWYLWMLRIQLAG